MLAECDIIALHYIMADAYCQAGMSRMSLLLARQWVRQSFGLT